MTILEVVLLAFAVLLSGAVATVCTVVVGLRVRSRLVRRLVSTLNRRIVNPRNLVNAGGTDSPWAVVTHRGRVSGREFHTPVQAVAALGGYVIALPYGPESDWVRNIQAASSAVLTTGGVSHELADIAIVPIESTPLLQSDGFALRLFGVRWGLWLRPMLRRQVNEELGDAAEDGADSLERVGHVDDVDQRADVDRQLGHRQRDVGDVGDGAERVEQLR